MRFQVIAAGLVFFAGFSLVAKADNLLSDPNFTPTSSDPYPGYGPVASWTESGTNTGAVTQGESFFDNGTLPGGDTTAGFIQGDGSFSQMLNLTPGSSYVLSFYVNARQLAGVNATPTLSVFVGGTELGAPLAVTPVGGSNLFDMVSELFTATSATELLDFSSMTPTVPGTNVGADGTLLLSDVEVSSTPEPSSLMLLGTGILGAAGMMRRRLLRA